MALTLFKREKKSAQPAATSGVLASGSVGQYIIRPHITEKATDLAKKNQYVFVVQPGANKKDIASSVEKRYRVNVEGVRMVNVHAKKVRLGKTKGMKKGYKKAMVEIQEGQKIEILPT